MLNVFLYLIIFIFIFLGCGPSGTCNSIKNINDSNISSPTTITVERGPVFMATVTDIKGNKAVNDNLGFSNIYRFATQPSYPITVTGGYIDINRDGKLDINDTKLDINMSSYSNVVSPLTTILGDDNKEIIKQLARYYPISEVEITQNIPSESSKNAILLSNIVYEALKKDYTIGSYEFNQTFEKIKDLYDEQNFNEITDLTQLAKLLEKKVIEELEVKRLTPIETENIDNNLSTHEIVGHVSFTKNYKTTDNIQDIWNLIFKIPKNTNIDKFDIGVHIVKNEPATIGDLLIEGISIKNNKVNHINSINVFGIKVSGATGSIGYDSRYDITKNSVAIVQGDSLLIKLGYIMEKQKIVSSDSFKRIADYNTTIYISKLDVNGSPILDDYNLQLEYNEFHTFPKGTQKINGLVQIGE